MMFDGFKKEYDCMPCTCPQCQSERINTYNYAKRTCGAVGTVAGAVAGAAGCISGAEIGAMAGFIAGPAGSAVGGIAGAVIAGLLGGAAGCAAGVKLGEVVDEHVLNNYYCLQCGYTFGSNSGSSEDEQHRRYTYQQDHSPDFDQEQDHDEQLDLPGHPTLPVYP
jgi:hypothetical protein